ncbi:MAG: Dyp-type peroxidase [Aestuariivirga sp.]|uniref:Dyp-type peroxidase n=1 Tax=Aestuariivirga sp. TaxID=2650926 RepID=UPI0038D22678
MPSTSQTVDLNDVQATVLRPRPSPYCGQYIVLKINDAAQGRAMVGRLIPHVASASRWWEPSYMGWLGIVFTYSGLAALGLPQDSLDSFPDEFKQGMAARANVLHDTGPNAPEHWLTPFGSKDVHVALAIYAKDAPSLEECLSLARTVHEGLPGIEVLYRLNFSELPGGRNPFGYRDGLHNPPIEGTAESASQGPTSAAPQAAAVKEVEPPLKAGEILLGYEDELGKVAQTPVPEALRLNGSFAAIRMYQANVASFRRFLRDNSNSPEEEELLAAKMVGRWRSGAPLVLAPETDNPQLGQDNVANDRFSYSDDERGLLCPAGAHIRRINPRDALKNDIVNVKLHKFIRRGTNFGHPLPEGVFEDDGAERGGVFLLIGTDLGRQFEFVQSQWIANGDFVHLGNEQDPMVGNNGPDAQFTIPKKPLRRRINGVPQFVTLRGGEYCFMPGIKALRWIASLGA